MVWLTPYCFPYVLKAYGETVDSSLYRLAVAAGVAEKDDSPQMGARKFINAIEMMNEKLGAFPAPLRAFGRKILNSWPAMPIKRPIRFIRCRS